MRYFITFFLTFFFFTSIYSQQKLSVIEDVAERIEYENIDKYVKELSGDLPIFINGKEYHLTNRWYEDTLNYICRHYLQQKLNSFGYETENFIAGEMLGHLSESVLAYKSGNDKKDEIVVFCAHYDTGGPDVPGADDNASGCSVVMEAARILKDFQFDKTIVFAFWDNEEIGPMGSWKWADTMKYAGIENISCINMDMIAYSHSDDHLLEFHGDTNTSISNLVDCMYETADICGFTTELIFKHDSFCSDQVGFAHNGYPAITLIERIDIEYLNPCYHQPCDIFDNLTIDYFHKNAEFCIQALCNWAEIKNTSIVSYNSDTINIAKAYPNPTDGIVHFEIKSENIYEILSIYNTIGKKVLEKSIEVNSPDITIDLSENGFTKGIYFVRFHSLDGQRSLLRKIIFK